MATLGSETLHEQPRGQLRLLPKSWNAFQDNYRESLSCGTFILYMTIFKLSKLIFILYRHQIYPGIKTHKVVLKVSVICMLSMKSASTVVIYLP